MVKFPLTKDTLLELVWFEKFSRPSQINGQPSALNFVDQGFQIPLV
jgi:hypothetical protein